MRIDVQILWGRAEIDYVPHLMARMLWGRPTVTRVAVRDACGNWFEDKTGRLVDAMTAAAIDDAVSASFRTPYSVVG